MLRSLRLPSFKIAALLLSLAAANDVFWVFIQPRITRAPSVMVTVASATPSLVLLAPGLRAGPHAPFFMLGFGDVALPGLAVAAAARWDAVRAQPPWTAGAGVGGYVVGLALTFFALLRGVGGGAGQPALLYLCPCVLAAVGAAAGVRGQAAAAWAGLDGGEDEDGGAV